MKEKKQYHVYVESPTKKGMFFRTAVEHNDGKRDTFYTRQEVEKYVKELKMKNQRFRVDKIESVTKEFE